MEEANITEEKEDKGIYPKEEQHKVKKYPVKKRLMNFVKTFLNDSSMNESSRLRNRKNVNYCLDTMFEEGEQEETVNKRTVANDEDYEPDGYRSVEESLSSEKSIKKNVRIKKYLNKKRKKNKLSGTNNNNKLSKHHPTRTSSFSITQIENEYSNEYIEITQHTNTKKEAINTIKEANELIAQLEKKFLKSELSSTTPKSIYPDFCIPINADVLSFNFDALIKKQIELTNKLFDVIMMDPPWQLSSSHPTRGVAIAYETLSDNAIAKLPIDKLQKDGFIFIWTINAKLHFALELMKQWGYRYCDEIVWVKQTVNGKIAKGHGYYLQHTKETCLVGIKGNPKFVKEEGNYDIIFSQRRGQSQKPTEIYERIEKLIPNGHYLELFGRRNNLRNFWVTIGNEL